MRICILILYTEGWSEIAKIVLPNVKEYCDKHGYSLDAILYRDSEYKSDFGYKKLTEIKRLLKNFDIVWSLDMDTLITNHNYKVEDFLGEHDFYITKDVNGINGGSFIVKNSAWSIAFLDICGLQKGLEGMHCEQDAINYYYPNFKDYIKILPHPSINSYKYELYPEFKLPQEGQWEEGDFVLHLPGLSIERRIKELKKTKIKK
jgi:hypothetical protein